MYYDSSAKFIIENELEKKRKKSLKKKPKIEKILKRNKN